MAKRASSKHNNGSLGKFIEVVPIEFKGSMGLRYVEDYFAVPADVAFECGYNVEVVSTASVTEGVINTLEKSGNSMRKLNFKVLSITGWPEYLGYLRSNKNATIFANDRTLQSMITSYFGKYRIFMSHQSRLPEEKFKRAVFKFFIKRFDAIKVSNPFEKEELIKIGVPPEKVHYIPIPIDHQFFSKKVPAKDLKDIKKKYDIKDDEIILLFLANVRKFKRPTTVLRAVEKLVSQGLNAKLIIAGYDALKTEGTLSVIDQARDLGIEHNVIVTGWVSPEEIRKLMNITDICVNSSIHEGQCLVVYEAACANIPLCLSNIGSFTSVFKGSALFHNPDDHDTLAKNLKHYIDNPKMASKNAAINKKIVVERCDYEKVKKQLKKLFVKE